MADALRSMHPLLAVLIVLIATASSTLLVLYIHRRETKHWAHTPLMVAITIWFLLWYGAIAFLVRPY